MDIKKYKKLLCNSTILKAVKVGQNIKKKYEIVSKEMCKTKYFKIVAKNTGYSTTKIRNLVILGTFAKKYPEVVNLSRLHEAYIISGSVYR